MVKFDPNPRHRLSRVDRRKTDRIREVDALPARARTGDQVYLDGVVYVRLRGEWKPIYSEGETE